MIKILVVVLALTVSSAAQIRFDPVDKDTVLHRLESAPLKNESRQQTLFEMFTSVGCNAELQPLKHSRFSNVICVLPGDSEDAIIVGGHFDKVDEGKGIVDDWSGASLLPTLYESLKGPPRRHTIIFVGFAEEEKGLVGSISYVKQMSPEARSHAKEMINLECLG